jgi:ferric-dicitrate binding protein FerR (iron transport regulator)
MLEIKANDKGRPQFLLLSFAEFARRYGTVPDLVPGGRHEAELRSFERICARDRKEQEQAEIDALLAEFPLCVGGPAEVAQAANRILGEARGRECGGAAALGLLWGMAVVAILTWMRKGA